MPDLPDLTGRDAFEDKFNSALYAEFQRFARMLGKVIPGFQSAFDNIPPEEWMKHTDKLNGIISPTMAEVFRTRSADIIDNLGFTDVDWGLVDTAAADWSRSYSGQLIKGIDSTTQTRVRQLTTDYFEQQWTQGQLTDAIRGPKNEDGTYPDGAFGKKRAEMIARTEVTTAASEGTQETQRQLAAQGVVMVEIWKTRNDEIVQQCPICWPRNGLPIQADNATRGELLPGHPRCRCWETLEFAKDEE